MGISTAQVIKTYLESYGFLVDFTREKGACLSLPPDLQEVDVDLLEDYSE